MKKFLLFMFAAFTFAACEQAPIEEQSAIRHEVPESITVGFEGDDTRIQLNEAQKTVWTKDDLVSVFYRSNANQQWKYDGETGARTAELKRVDAGTATRDIDRVVVVYPYDENYYINPETYNVQASLPAVQNYLQNSYGTNGNIMISSSEYNQFSLKSVCGWLKLQIMGDGEKIKSIKLRGNNGEQVAGELYINSADATAALAADMGSADDNNAGGSLVFDDTIIEEVTLDCGEGVALGKSATMFYIALPPQTFTQGIYVAIEDTEGYVMEQSTDKAVTIARNTILPMATFEFINPATPSAPAPSTNEIWYTATAKVEPTFDDAITFGADVVSNVWDSETKRGVISFNGDVTMIGEAAFNSCSSLTSITIPDSVTSIGDSAFYDCDSLTSITIPDSVTEIGDSAFYDCDSLTSITIPDSVTTIGSQAFYICSSLTSVTIGDSVTEIGTQVFRYCYSLTEFKGKFADGDGRILVVDGELIAFAQAGITEYTIPDSVTSIGSSAFYYCSSLINVTIPDSVTSIGYEAFNGCYSLTSITIPDSVTTIGNYAFRYCYNLTSITIPDSVTSIGSSAFYSCNSLTSIIIPDSVTSIGGQAFCNCDSLKKVYCYATIPPSLSSNVFANNASGRRIYVYEECVELYKSFWSGYEDSIYTNGKNCPDTTTIEYTTSDGNTITSSKFPIISNNYENGVGTLIVAGTITHIPDFAFSNCYSLTSITIPDSVTTIGFQVFCNCDRLTSITIPDSVTSIRDYAFYNCNSLTSITIPDSVTTIGGSAFGYCNSLTSIIIPDSVTTIGDSAFYSCSSLTSITIPNSVTSIGDSAFYYCDSLISITIPDSVTSIGYQAFYDCDSLASITIPYSVTSIGDSAFYNCDSLTSITIPDSVTSIGGSSFYSCNSLTSITIPDSVTSIGSQAFYGCDSLTSITIPDSVTWIGSYAFNDCDSLTSVYCKATTPPTLLGNNSFSNNGSGRKIYVPAASIEVYKSARYWDEYASAMVGYDFENGVVVE